jgi:hypothetical protein
MYKSLLAKSKGIYFTSLRFLSINPHFCTQSHTWISPIALNEKIYFLGITDRFLDHCILGDIENIVLDTSKNEIVFKYSSLTISSADELYHAQWGNIEGQYLLTLPDLKFSYHVELNPELVRNPSLLSPQVWIAKLIGEML